MEIAAEECDLQLTVDQLDCIANAAKMGHEHYGMAFYSPPTRERIDSIESEWKARLKRLQDEFDAYRNHAESAVKKALHIHRDARIAIEQRGEVLVYGGRTERIQ